MKLQTLILGLMTTSAASVIAVAALADPPERAGRVAYVEGEVSFQPPESDFWTQATRNYPVAPGESFWTGDNGRAELRIGFAEARLDNETEMDIVDTGYGTMRLAMPQGSASIRLRQDPSAPISISTPAGDVHLDRAGLYRIDVGAQGDDGSYPPVEVTVFEGEADAPSSEGPAYVDPGEAGLVYAGYDPEMQDAQDASIDDWARDREAREQWRPRPEVSVNMTGYEDLEGAGNYVSNPQYGTVWFPREVPADWAPYRYGHWAYVAPWGYTWIDDQPWGFAPFHYGRWAQVEGRWGWIPGRPEPRPVYAPALVAFVGGGGFSVGVAIGGGGAGVQALGWVPLAPDEVYRPPYQVSSAYVRNVNVTNVSTTTINKVVNNTTINNVTVNNYKNVSAVTVVRADALSKGGSVQQARVQVSPAELAKARPVESHAALPPPTPAAKAGVAHVATASGQPAAPPKAAPPPPAKLQAVRTAVVTQAPGASKPPVIAGAKIAPPQPKPAGAPAKALIAPAQVHNPAAQGKQAVAPPAHPTPAKPRTAPTMPKPQATRGAPAVEPKPMMAKAPPPTAPAKPAVAPAPKPKAKTPAPIVAAKPVVAPAVKPKAKAPPPTAPTKPAVAPAPKPKAKAPAPTVATKPAVAPAPKAKAKPAPAAKAETKTPAAPPQPKAKPAPKPAVIAPAPAANGTKPTTATPGSAQAKSDAQAKAKLKAEEDAKKRKAADEAAGKPTP